MSRRGRSQGVAISLFSFQDIITSVTAIMILLVLILTLELSARTATRGMAAEDRRVAAELRKSLQERERVVQQARQRAADVRISAREAAGYSASNAARRLAAAQRRRREVDREIEQLELQLSRAQVSRREAEANLVVVQSSPRDSESDRAEELERRAGRMEEANEEERARQAAEESRSRESPGTTRTLVFNAPPDDRLRPVLVEVSKTGIATAATGTAPGRRFPWGLLGGPSQAFASWLASRDASREYVVIILRPSGIDQYDAVREAVVSAGLAVGTELIGEAMDLVLGKQ